MRQFFTAVVLTVLVVAASTSALFATSTPPGRTAEPTPTIDRPVTYLMELMTKAQAAEDVANDDTGKERSLEEELMDDPAWAGLSPEARTRTLNFSLLIVAAALFAIDDPEAPSDAFIDWRHFVATGIHGEPERKKMSPADWLAAHGPIPLRTLLIDIARTHERIDARRVALEAEKKEREAAQGAELLKTARTVSDMVELLTHYRIPLPTIMAATKRREFQRVTGKEAAALWNVITEPEHREHYDGHWFARFLAPGELTASFLVFYRPVPPYQAKQLELHNAAASEAQRLSFRPNLRPDAAILQRQKRLPQSSSSVFEQGFVVHLRDDPDTPILGIPSWLDAVALKELGEMLARSEIPDDNFRLWHRQRSADEFVTEHRAKFPVHPRLTLLAHLGQLRDEPQKLIGISARKWFVVLYRQLNGPQFDRPYVLDSVMLHYTQEPAGPLPVVGTEQELRALARSGRFITEIDLRDMQRILVAGEAAEFRDLRVARQSVDLQLTMALALNALPAPRTDTQLATFGARAKSAIMVALIEARIGRVLDPFEDGVSDDARKLLAELVKR